MQVRELNGYSGKQGWPVVETYEDVISGAKSSQPGLNRLMEDARARKLAACWSGNWIGLGAPR
jgi:DNA invertase Pin-like site-specific DNA recombinase